MKRIVCLLLLATLLPGFAGAREAAPLAADPAMEDRVKTLGQDLRCLVCQNQTLSDSNAPLAEDLRQVIREQIRLGKNDEQVRGFLVERYGDFVLYKPPLKASTLLLWIGPFVLLALGLTVLVALLRKRRLAPNDAPTPDPKARDQARRLLEADQDEEHDR
ncbi:Cytochrome c-type biogenesis protein CcmH [Burkholderiales bacterium]|nr:MAG: cytochrome c-type biogenesis protein CcmH [Burkholderiales bacterium]CAG1001808.1 Cytochrome c-type biogenesis protein CcmH [Burkholderiales bacterium]